MNNCWRNNLYILVKILMHLRFHSSLTENQGPRHWYYFQKLWLRSALLSVDSSHWIPRIIFCCLGLWLYSLTTLLTKLQNIEIEILTELAYKLTFFLTNYSISFYSVNFINLNWLWEILNRSNLSVVLTMGGKVKKIVKNSIIQ